MLLPLDPPPGASREGTDLQIGGKFSPQGVEQPRIVDMSLTRWHNRILGPIGGWLARSADTVIGKARAVTTYRIGSSTRWIVIGTHEGAFAMNAPGDLFEITPADFVAGQPSETSGSGFGGSVFGSGIYGAARPDSGSATAATVWDLDKFGDIAIGCCPSDGRILEWDGGPGSDFTPVTNAPTGCIGVFVTEQGFIMAGAADGDVRKMKWSDQGARTVWTAAPDNQAGDFTLVTQGSFVKGVRLGPIGLILTDLDAHICRYQGLPNVYIFERVGTGCGALSKGCIVPLGSEAAWWSKSGFWRIQGTAVRKLQCPLDDFLTRTINHGQRSKITGMHNSQFGEAWWFYPSSESSENDRYVFWAYRLSEELGMPVWGMGAMSRTCGVEPSVFKFPVALDADGNVYEHENGSDYYGAEIFAETGLFSLGMGDQVLGSSEQIFDETTEGLTSLVFKTRDYPGGAETNLSAITPDANGRGFARFESRFAKARYVFEEDATARHGRLLLDLQPGGGR